MNFMFSCVFEMAPWEDYLKRIYYNPKHPGSYAGPKKLYEAVKTEGKFKIGLFRIKKWLKGQDRKSVV